MWGVWGHSAFLCSTASRALHNIQFNPEATVHLERGDQVVIVEGSASIVDDVPTLQDFVRAYNRKYSWDLTVDGARVVDSRGNGGHAVIVLPRVVYGWGEDLETATRWTFDLEP